MTTKRTIEVIPRYVARNAEGNECSAYGAIPPGYSLVRFGWTWRRIGARGDVTIGLGRVPVKSKAEAEAIARQVCERTGAHYGGVKE